MSDVPSDIVDEILYHLPVDCLFRFRSVSKAWRRIIDDRIHSTLLIRDSKGGRLYSLSLDSLDYIDGYQTIDVTPVKQLIHRGVPRIHSFPVASCNGLILIPDYVSKNNWVIWNPMIGDFRKLPESHILTKEFGCKYDWLKGTGFGYDYLTDDYKVVRIDRLHRGTTIVYRTLVHSLKLGFWRMIKDCPFGNLLFNGEGVFLKGALHWRSRDGIVVLDLGTEDFRQLQRPFVPTIPDDFYERLDALGGCLIFSCYHKKAKSFEGWMMRDYGVETSWMKLFSIEEFKWYPSWPVAYLKRKRQFLLHQEYYMGDAMLYWLDLEKNSIKKVTIDGLSRFSSV